MKTEIVLLFVAVAVLAFLCQYAKTKMQRQSNEELAKYYRSRWLFSTNEKNAFFSLKEITDTKGLYLFSKVRLFDLIEPNKDRQKYKTLQYKIQAKHVDFVICDSKLVARYIIELDDSSHDIDSRRERDIFVDAALTNCGYKVLHVRAINKEQILNFLQ